MNCSGTDYMAQAERNKLYPQIIPASCACKIILMGVAQCSIILLFE